MPYFVVLCRDHDDVLAQRLEARPAHLARLVSLQQQGRVLLAGPMPKDSNDPSQGYVGSTLIVDFDSRQELDAWLAEEPYLLAGVYKEIEVQAFVKVFPKDEA